MLASISRCSAGVVAPSLATFPGIKSPVSGILIPIKICLQSEIPIEENEETDEIKNEEDEE